MLFSSLQTILVMAISHTLEARRGRRTATAWPGILWSAVAGQRNTAFAPPHLKRRCGFALPAVSKEKEAGQNARPLVCEIFLVKPTKLILGAAKLRSLAGRKRQRARCIHIRPRTIH